MQNATRAMQNTLQTSSRAINAVVTSAGLMQKTVKVRIGTQKWNKKVRKYFNRHTSLLVHDARNSLRTGDIVEISPGWRVSKDVRHVVNKIIAPFGESVEAREPIMTREEREAERINKKLSRDTRRGKILEKVMEFESGQYKDTGKKILNDTEVHEGLHIHEQKA